MDFSVDQVFAGSGDVLAQAYASAELYPHLAGLPKLDTPEVLDRQVDGDVVRLQIRYRFVGDLSPAVTAVLDPRKLTWVEHSTHDLAARTVDYRLVPDHYRDRLRSSGACTVTDRTNGGSVRTVIGRLQVKALVVGPAVERAIVSGLREYLSGEAPLVDRYAASHTG
ncbi:MAG TPA: DUF2505 family protein [Acidimicrobiales bacterium]|nr:DUF2505 family protein [Acidimicrobiales bacterium]